MKKSAKYIHWVEYDNRHYIAIGKYGSPWNQRIQIRLPKVICKLLNLKF